MPAKGQTSSLVTDEGRECTGCKEFKPWSEYYKSAASCHGHQARCKVCDCRPTPSARHPKPAGQAPKSRRTWAITSEGRECAGCESFKPWSAFSPNPRAATGYFPRCRECRSDRRDYYLRHHFGITEADFLALLARYSDTCWLCHELETQLHAATRREMRLAIDHDHLCPNHAETKGCRYCIRGILCNRCNRLIALAEQHPALAARFADYLLAPRPLAA